LLSSLLFISSVYAGTYFVDTNGEDSANGSSSKPWKTIAYALYQANYGDTISINNGTYTEGQLKVPAGVSLTSTSKNNSKVKLQPNTNLGTSKPFILLSSNPGSVGNQTISYLEIAGINGTNRAKIGIGVQSRDNVRIHHCNIHDFYGVCWAAAVEVISKEPFDAEGWWDFWPADSGPLGDDSNIVALWPANPVVNFELDNNTINDCGWYGKDRTGSVNVFHLKNSTIHHNSFAMNKSRGQAIIGRGLNGLGKTALLNNVDIYNNKIDMGEKYTDTDNFMIEMWVMRNGCEFFNNQGEGWYSITVGKETTVRNNSLTISPQESDKGIGIEFKKQSHGTVSHNYVENAKWGIHTGYSFTGKKDWVFGNITIKENAVYNSRYYGIWVTCLGSTSKNIYAQFKNINVFNNYVVGNEPRGNYGISVAETTNESECLLSDVNVSGNMVTGMVNAAGKTTGSVDNVSVYDNNFYNNTSNSWFGSNDTGTSTSDPGLPIPPDKPEEWASSSLIPPILYIVN
jgi:hypothetical protein